MMRVTFLKLKDPHAEPVAGNEELDSGFDEEVFFRVLSLMRRFDKS